MVCFLNVIIPCNFGIGDALFVVHPVVGVATLGQIQGCIYQNGCETK